MKTVRRPPYPKWNPGYFPCSSLTPPSAFLTPSIGVLRWIRAKAYGLFFGSSEFPPYDAGNFATVDFEDEGGEHEYLVSSTPTDGEFHHHAFVRQGNTQTLFFDGEIVASASFTRTVGDTTDLPLVIGNIYQVPETGDFAFGGIIDEVQVYNRALSDSEVQRIFDADDPDAVHQVTVRATFKAGERTASVSLWWIISEDIKGFNAPLTVQTHFKHEDLWLDR